MFQNGSHHNFSCWCGSDTVPRLWSSPALWRGILSIAGPTWRSRGLSRGLGILAIAAYNPGVATDPWIWGSGNSNHSFTLTFWIFWVHTWSYFLYQRVLMSIKWWFAYIATSQKMVVKPWRFSTDPFEVKLVVLGPQLRRMDVDLSLSTTFFFFLRWSFGLPTFRRIQWTSFFFLFFWKIMRIRDAVEDVASRFPEPLRDREDPHSAQDLLRQVGRTRWWNHYGTFAVHLLETIQTPHTPEFWENRWSRSFLGESWWHWLCLGIFKLDVGCRFFVLGHRFEAICRRKMLDRVEKLDGAAVSAYPGAWWRLNNWWINESTLILISLKIIEACFVGPSTEVEVTAAEAGHQMVSLCQTWVIGGHLPGRMQEANLIWWCSCMFFWGSSPRNFQCMN